MIGKKAIVFLEKGKNSETMAYYFLGHAYLLDKNYKAAANSFNEYMKGGSSEKRLWQFAEFYSAISLLGDGNVTAAKQLFEQISNNPNHRRSPDSANILKDFEK